MSASASSGTQKQFRSVNTLAKWVQGTFVVLAILCVIAVISGYAQAQLLNAVINGEVITEAEAMANDARQSMIGVMQTLLYIAAGIIFLVWVHRTHSNLPSLGAIELRFTPGWAVGWFFIPIMSLFRPYQVASEIWKASDPNVDTTDNVSWKNVATSPIVGWWWAPFLISNYIGLFAMRMILRGEELSDLLASTYAYMVSDAIDVVGILITILMVRRIGQFQEAKNKLISSP